MTQYLLDTNTVSHFLRDHSPALTARLMGTVPNQRPSLSERFLEFLGTPNVSTLVGHQPFWVT